MNYSLRLTLTLTCALTLGTAPASAQVSDRALVAIEAANSVRGQTPPERAWIDLSHDAALVQSVSQLQVTKLAKRDDVLVCERVSQFRSRCRITDGDLIIVVKSVDVEGAKAEAVVDVIWIARPTDGRLAYVRYLIELDRSERGWTVSSKRSLIES
jgi:hypothetical protein